MNNKMVNTDPVAPRESFTDLLEQLANNSAAVVRDEIALVIQGIREKVTAARGGVLTIVAGAAISFAAFMCLCAALILRLTDYMAPDTAAFVTGAALALIGVIFVFIGCRGCKRSIPDA